MAPGKHREMADVEQTKKTIPFITRESTFGQHVRKLVLGVNIYDFGCWDPSGFCRTTNLTQLCGFWTSVDFVL